MALSELPVLSDTELDLKLKLFLGKKNDPRYAEDVQNAGALFADESKEHIDVSMKTYKKVLERSGGILPFLIMLIVMCFNHYWGTLQEYGRSDWGLKSHEEQQDNYAYYTIQMTKYALVGSIVNLGIEIFISIKAKGMGKNVHLMLFSKVMSAPINLFFDVTPVGKVFQRFSEDINVFNGAIFWGFRRIMGNVTYLLFLFHLLISISNWLFVFFFMLSWLAYYVVRPYLAADNQLHRVGHPLHTQGGSYLDSAVRGKTVIRAFDECNTFKKGRGDHYDKITLNFMTHHSCWVWFNLRIYYVSKLIFVATVVVVIAMKGKYDNIMLSILFSRCLDLDWTFHCIFGTFNWVERMMVQVERVLKLENIPQEKFQGTEEAAAEWPAQGGIDF